MSKERRNIQIKNSLIPKKYLKNVSLVPEEKDYEAFKRIKYIIDNVVSFINEGQNLYLYSPFCGNGKTTIATKIAKEYITSYAENYGIDYPVIFINAADFLEKRKQCFSDGNRQNEFSKFVENVENADLVIWDDIATKALSEYDMEQLYVYINRRLSNGKSNIYTSNSNGNDLRQMLGERLYSRVFKDSIQIKLMGADKRGNSTWFNFKQ